MTLAAGVDVGGTKIDACIADPRTGKVVARARIPSLPERAGQDVLDDCIEVAGPECADADALGAHEHGACAGVIARRRGNCHARNREPP